jgi:FemAB-related protein (PEP-CTERM system-associated)
VVVEISVADDTTELLGRLTNPGPVECAVATVSDAAVWDAFVHSRSDSSGYHQWGWRTVFETALRHRCHYLVARRGVAVVGVLPLVEMRSWLFGRALSSLPFVNYGGVLASDETAAAALVEHASELARSKGLSYVLLRHRRRTLPHLSARDHKVTMLLRLSSSRQVMWDELDRKVRNQIRKAEKSNLTVVSGGTALLDEFYAVFARNMRDLGTPVYGRSLFAAILAEFPADARLHVVRLNGQPIAGALSYAFGDSIEVPSASSLREHRALCPNHLMYWSIMQQAIAEGRRVFDFGRSTPDDGTYSFKEQWGARPQQLFWEYSLLNGSVLPSDDRHSTKFRASIEAWKRLPVWLATRVGPRIARFVP